MSRNRIRCSPPLLVAALAAGCGADTSSGEDDTGLADGPACVDDATFFKEQVYPRVIQDTCMGCHTTDGLARNSDLVFVTPARPDHAEVNRATLAAVAGLERDGVSIALLKPLGAENHGGGAVLTEDSDDYTLLEQFVQRLDAPIQCADAGRDATGEEGLELLSAAQTLRKAALLLVGRLPTPAETDAVRAGGEPALVAALWQMMAEEAFTTVFLEKWNDVLHTDRYLNGRDGIGIVDDDRFPNLYWYEDVDGDYDDLDDLTSAAIAREPLALAAHLLEQDRPWTELITADYTMVNAYSAMAYGLPYDGYPDPNDPSTRSFYPAKLDGFPHAGLLTTPAFLNRYPTTDTNRNRHRAWFFFKTFLATDILTFADRPIDPTISNAHNPTLNDAQCTVCHATMDPVAGAFQNWDDQGRLASRDEGWYADMRPPGFGEQTVPYAQSTSSVRWLGQQAADDPRFAVATVRTMLEAFTGIDLLTPLLAGDDPVKLEALGLQDAWIEEVADEFGKRGFEIKYVVERVITSRFFRAAHDLGATDGAVLQMGTAHLLTPEELDRKIVATLGMPWRRSSSSETYLEDRYEMLYGGIDSFAVTERLTDPNGVIGAIGLRMAHEMACEAVPHDFVLDKSQRRLFPLVDLSFQPFTDDGFEVPGARAAILENLRWLHLRLLGEDLSPGDPELEATYDLWVDVWKAGKDGVTAGAYHDRLDDACTARVDPWTGDGLPDDRELTRDPDFTVRAWVAVTAYLLADWHFLYE